MKPMETLPFTDMLTSRHIYMMELSAKGADYLTASLGDEMFSCTKRIGMPTTSVSLSMRSVSVSMTSPMQRETCFSCQKRMLTMRV